MSEISTVPDLVAAVADLRRRVYELTRRRLPQGSGTVSTGSASVDDPLQQSTAGAGAFLETGWTTDITDARAETHPFTFADPWATQTWGPVDDGTQFNDDGPGNYFWVETNSDTFQDAFFAATKANGHATAYGDLTLFQSSSMLNVHAENDANTRSSDIEFFTNWGGSTQAEFDLEARKRPSGAKGDFIMYTNAGSSRGFTYTFVYDDTTETGVTFGTNFGHGGADTFGIFDQFAGAVQQTAVVVSGESAAFQTFYAALRAYGWFAA